MKLVLGFPYGIWSRTSPKNSLGMGNQPTSSSLPYRLSRRKWLSPPQNLNYVDALDAHVLNLIVLPLDQTTTLNLILTCKHFRILSETLPFWSGTIPSNMKFMHCLPALTYDELMKPPGPGTSLFLLNSHFFGPFSQKFRRFPTFLRPLRLLVRWPSF